jgi:RHS repeat-associated protein
LEPIPFPPEAGEREGGFYHLGTITHLKTGSTITEYSFDAWGRRRNALNWSYDLTGQPALFADRGFTSHEFLADFNLYNMNGRLYDPVVGRFLSPDPFITDPSFSQSYNRYSYALNNPLKFTDPSGEKLKWPKFEWFHAIPLIGQFDYMVQMVNDNTPQLRQNMVNTKIPNFGFGVSVNGNGNVNFNGSYRGQEVFNTQNINKGNPDVVLNELVQVRRDYGEAWHASGDGVNPWTAAFATVGVLAADDVTGFGAVDDIAIPFVLATAATYDLTQRVYVTYTLTGPQGKKYAGRASGFGNPKSVMMRRYYGHHMKSLGYSNPTLDVWRQGIYAYPAIRGREQQLIDFYGGIGSSNVGNSIRGVGYYNLSGRFFHGQSNLYFGPLAPYTGF